MAIDLVESIYTRPHLDTYVVVSGDRDFLPVINALKRAGKRVIALSTSRAMSKEMKRVCDKTATYESLLHEESYSSTTPRRDPQELLDEVLSIAKNFDSGILTGAQLKQLLVHSHNGRFAERDYGFVSFGALMDYLAQLSREQIGDNEDIKMPILHLNRPPQGDLQIALDLGEYEGTLPASVQGWQSTHELQLALASLKGYQYMQNAEQRRGILVALYTALSPPTGACWAEALDEVCDLVGLSRSQASKYHAVLLQSQAFIQVDPNDESPVKQRKMKLIASLNSSQALIKRYEQSILHKIITRRGSISTAIGAQVLGIEVHQHREYIDELITAAFAESNNQD